MGTRHTFVTDHDGIYTISNTLVPLSESKTTQDEVFSDYAVQKLKHAQPKLENLFKSKSDASQIVIQENG